MNRLFYILALLTCLAVNGADSTIGNLTPITTVPDVYRMPWENPGVLDYYITFANLTNQVLSGYASQGYAQSMTNGYPWTNLPYGNINANGYITATNGFRLQYYATNGYTVCATNKQVYLVNSTTNAIFVLPNASSVPGLTYYFSTTNVNASFIVTNATGTQTIRDGTSLSYTNTDNGIKVCSFISDGGAWWLTDKGRTTLPCASWSCSTNTTFANVTNTVTLDTTEANNLAGITLDNSAWWTAGVGSRMWVTNPGMYMITFSAVWSKVGGGAANGDIWLRQNSVDIARTMTLMTIQNATSTNVMTVNFIVPVTQTTYFDLQGASPDGTAQLQALPAIASPFNRPACPSIIVTINKVSD